MMTTTSCRVIYSYNCVTHGFLSRVRRKLFSCFHSLFDAWLNFTQMLNRQKLLEREEVDGCLQREMRWERGRKQLEQEVEGMSDIKPSGRKETEKKKKTKRKTGRRTVKQKEKKKSLTHEEEKSKIVLKISPLFSDSPSSSLTRKKNCRYSKFSRERREEKRCETYKK